jgi:ketosteroid isomerase-like protein
MQKKITVLFSSILISLFAAAQTSDKVSQLISAENYFATLTQKKGIKKAFLSVSTDNTLIFKPEPISPSKYFKGKPDSLGFLNWEPVFARIAKSGDWGFTSGPFTFKESDSSKVVYGNYLSIWQKNRKGVWKLAIDLGVTHPRPKKEPQLLFQNPKNEIYLKQRSQNRLQQREDVVFSSDKLMGTILKADDPTALNEFIGDDSRLLFPGYEPIIGKKAITNFWAKQEFNLTSTPIKADRSYSGELAYTYGTASIAKKGDVTNYHYVRVWEVQPGYVWNVIFEAYVPMPKDQPSE